MESDAAIGFPKRYFFQICIRGELNIFRIYLYSYFKSYGIFLISLDAMNENNPSIKPKTIPKGSHDRSIIIRGE